MLPNRNQNSNNTNRSYQSTNNNNNNNNNNNSSRYQLTNAISLANNLSNKAHVQFHQTNTNRNNQPLSSPLNRTNNYNNLISNNRLNSQQAQRRNYHQQEHMIIARNQAQTGPQPQARLSYPNIRIIKNLIKSFTQIQQQYYFSTLEQLKNFKIQSHLQLALLNRLPKDITAYALNAFKMNTFMSQNFNFCTQEHIFKILITVYTRYLSTNLQQFSRQQLSLINSLNQFFRGMFQLNQMLRFSLKNQFIRYNLQIIRILKPNNYGWFIDFIISQESTLDYLVFTQCAIVFLNFPLTFNIDHQKSQMLAQIINKMLWKFLQQMKVDVNSQEYYHVSILILSIIRNFKSTNPHPSIKALAKALMVSQNFCIGVFLILKRYNNLSKFKQLVQILIKTGEFKCACDFVQFALFLHTNIIDKLQIEQLIEENEAWAQFLSERTIQTNLLTSSNSYLVGDPSLFKIFNLILQRYTFINENHLEHTLALISYGPAFLKLASVDQEVRVSTLKFLSNFYDDDAEKFLKEFCAIYISE